PARHHFLQLDERSVPNSAEHTLRGLSHHFPRLPKVSDRPAPRREAARLVDLIPAAAVRLTRDICLVIEVGTLFLQSGFDVPLRNA
ncbi:MAG: hypothetical protein LC796_01135, partial [Acidobacteria bacterium]|nr:hypothetical protein [Acidobacteriota bacterium]